MMRRLAVVFIALVSTLSTQGAHAHSFSVSETAQKMFRNISPPGTLPGIVVASDSRRNPNYWYHWVRDAALVMDAVMDLYEAETDPIKKQVYFESLLDYAYRVRQLQEEDTLAGLGEPKYHVDGSPFRDDWGRPQNDGPALRALLLMRLAQDLVAQGEDVLVSSLFYDGQAPSRSIIKKDLDYVVRHWEEMNFDLWEEVKGDHFYTRLVQQAALQKGASFARSLGDWAAAQTYQQAAGQVAETLSQFAHPRYGYIRSSVNDDGGKRGKNSGLDTSTILAALHTKGEASFSYSDERLLLTAKKLIQVFDEIYPINNYRAEQVAPALGRYPEDVYFGGNPWVLTTNAMAEFYFSLRDELRDKGEISLTEKSLPFYRRLMGRDWRPGRPDGLLIREGSSAFTRILQQLTAQGESFLDRVALHQHPNGNLNEQIHRETGYMLAASNLTWSYASLLTALLAQSP